MVGRHLFLGLTERSEAAPPPFTPGSDFFWILLVLPGGCQTPGREEEGEACWVGVCEAVPYVYKEWSVCGARPGSLLVYISVHLLSAALGVLCSNIHFADKATGAQGSLQRCSRVQSSRSMTAKQKNPNAVEWGSSSSDKTFTGCAQGPPWTQSQAPQRKLGMGVHACNVSTYEVEAGGSEVQAHPQLH